MLRGNENIAYDYLIQQKRIKHSIPCNSTEIIDGLSFDPRNKKTHSRAVDYFQHTNYENAFLDKITTTTINKIRF